MPAADEWCLIPSNIVGFQLANNAAWIQAGCASDKSSTVSVVNRLSDKGDIVALVLNWPYIAQGDMAFSETNSSL